MAAGWGAVFAAPFTGVMFALQVCKHQRRRVIVPAIIAGFAGKFTVEEVSGDGPAGEILASYNAG